MHLIKTRLPCNAKLVTHTGYIAVGAVVTHSCVELMLIANSLMSNNTTVNNTH